LIFLELEQKAKYCGKFELQKVIYFLPVLFLERNGEIDLQIGCQK